MPTTESIQSPTNGPSPKPAAAPSPIPAAALSPIPAAAAPSPIPAAAAPSPIPAAAPSPIPAAVQSLLALFEAELADVRFPDVDAAVLAGAASEVRDLADAVARAEAALDAARAALDGGQEQLLGRAQRALAYARIYAEDDPALAGRLDAIALPRAARRTARDPAAAATTEGAGDLPSASSAPRRGRPRRDAGAPALFSTTPDVASATAATL